MDKIDVLDKGYVRLNDSMGDDRSIVNAARVSFDKESAVFNDKDEKLLNFLAREGHTAPFRHATLAFEVYAPLLVARQWWKHVVGSSHQDVMVGWNESSRRYVTENEEFYVPKVWRKAADNKKQGSGENLTNPENVGWTYCLNKYIKESVETYERALRMGVAPEQARLFLPAYGLYIRWRWTASLQGVLHFLQLRLDSHAQKEIQEYARAVEQLTRQQFPKSVEAFLGIPNS